MCTGSPAWTTGAYDPDTNILYWTTGNPGPDWNGDLRATLRCVEVDDVNAPEDCTPGTTECADPNRVSNPLCPASYLQILNPVQQIDGNGQAQRLVDFTSPPAGSGPGQITPGSTWYFQFWYRDPQGPGGTGFNTSDGLEVRFSG